MAEPVVVPKLNENDDEVVVVSLAEGLVARGKVLFEVETSKALTRVEASQVMDALEDLAGVATEDEPALDEES